MKRNTDRVISTNCPTKKKKLLDTPTVVAMGDEGGGVLAMDTNNTTGPEDPPLAYNVSTSNRFAILSIPIPQRTSLRVAAVP